MKEFQELTLDQLANETEETLEGFDETVNLNEGLAPLPDGKYLAKLELTPEGGIQKRVDKNGRTYYQVNAMGTVQEPGSPNDGRKFFDRLNTIVFRGSNRLASLLVEAGIRPLPSASGQALQLVKALEGGLLIKAKTQWEASWQKVDGTYDRLRKMANFPKTEEGKPIPVVITPDGTEAKAFVTVVAYQRA